MLIMFVLYTLVHVESLGQVVSKVLRMIRKAVAMLISHINLTISVVMAAEVCRTWTPRDDRLMSV